MSIVVDSGGGWTVCAKKLLCSYLAPNRAEIGGCKLDCSVLLPKMANVRDVVRLGGTYKCRASLTSQLDVDDKGCLALSDLNGGRLLYMTLVDFEECVRSLAQVSGAHECTLFVRGDKFVINTKIEPLVTIRHGEPRLTLDERAVAILYDNVDRLREEMAGEGECCCPLRTGYMELACSHDTRQYRMTLLAGSDRSNPQLMLSYGLMEHLLVAVEAIVHLLDVFVL